MSKVYVLVILAIAFFLCGCKSEGLKPAPTQKIVYMPEEFEDSRVKANPWRNDDDRGNERDPSTYVPRGPLYPYQLIYNPRTGNYEVVLREGAPRVEGSILKYSRSAAPYTVEVPTRE